MDRTGEGRRSGDPDATEGRGRCGQQKPVFSLIDVIMSLPGKGLEQEPNEKASKGSKRENYNCSREGTEDFQRTISIS